MPAVLLVLGVPERTVMGLVGWSSSSMIERYQHLADDIRQGVAAQIGGLVCGGEEAGTTEKSGDDKPN